MSDNCSDNFTDDDADDVTISTPDPTKTAIWFISSFGIVANIFVVVTIANYRPMTKKLTNIFIVNQSAIDTLAAFMLLFTTLFEDDNTPRTPGNTLDEFVCKVWYSKLLLWGVLVASTYGIVMLSLEKYLAVVHPVWYTSKFARRRVAVAGLLATPWVLGIGVLSSYTVPSSMVRPSGHCTTYSVWVNPQTQAAVGVMIFAFQYFLPIVVLVYLYVSMALHLHKRVGPTWSPDPKDPAAVAPWRNATMAKARSNVIKTLATVSVFYVLCWSLNQFYFVLFNTGALFIDATGTFYSVTVILVFLNCCVNPVIYSVKYKQFQNGVVFLFRRCKIGQMAISVIPAITIRSDLTIDDDRRPPTVAE